MIVDYKYKLWYNMMSADHYIYFDFTFGWLKKRVFSKKFLHIRGGSNGFSFNTVHRCGNAALRRAWLYNDEGENDERGGNKGDIKADDIRMSALLCGVRLQSA